MSSLKTLKKLHNIKRCTIIYTEHTLQNDIPQPYQAWKLGPVSNETSLFHVGKMHPMTNFDNTLEETVARIGAQIQRRRGEAACTNRGEELEFEIMCIHGRERKYLPEKKLKRGEAGWEMDWFG